MTRPTWDEYFGLMTQIVALRSDDAETRVGAVIVDKNNRIVSTGYNGTPKGTSGLPTHRPEKYPYMVHAEQNAIIFAKQDLTDCKIYILGMLPCDTCARLICQSGIKQVFVVNESIRYGGADWKPTEVLEMFRQCKVTVKQVETSPINFY